MDTNLSNQGLTLALMEKIAKKRAKETGLTKQTEKQYWLGLLKEVSGAVKEAFPDGCCHKE